LIRPIDLHQLRWMIDIHICVWIEDFCRRVVFAVRLSQSGCCTVNGLLHRIGAAIARHLGRPAKGYEAFPWADAETLRTTLRPGDVLLVEGSSRISGAIKYLTRSPWSHAALYVGPIAGRATADGEPHVLIEVDMVEGAIAVPLSKYARFHTRICRPVGLTAADRDNVCAYAIARIGLKYDLRNITDLIRYLVPLPVPRRWRRHMIALGSGDPTRSICSVLIAQAFQSVRYPILPKITRSGSKAARREILAIRQSSLYAPRDFDISPYFAVIKPVIETGFNYRRIAWADRPAALIEVPEAAGLPLPGVDPRPVDGPRNQTHNGKIGAHAARQAGAALVARVSPDP
jgi:hypothetical protein